MQELIIAFIIWSMVGIAFALLSCAGILIETIAVMIVYVTVIEKKYRKSERSYR